MHRMFLVLLASASLFWTVGCGSEGSGPDTVSVSGTVYLNGNPLERAQITFSSDDFSSSGVTSSDGTYELAQGAVPGEYKVSITMWEGESDFKSEDGMDEGQLEAAAGGATEPSKVNKGEAQSVEGMGKQTIPAEYNTNSTLTYKVPTGGAKGADFRMKSK